MACVMVAYGAICGRDSSVTRAVLMGGIGILAIYAGRVAVTWRTMLIVMLLMLVRRPYALLYDA